jgi:hypothetical protein
MENEKLTREAAKKMGVWISGNSSKMRKTQKTYNKAKKKAEKKAKNGRKNGQKNRRKKSGSGRVAVVSKDAE